MGKTTYSQKLAYDWATKQEQEEWDESFPEIEVLLLLRCHDIKSDIWEAIEDQILPVDVDDETKESFFKFIREKQSRVLLVLDGLDEADPRKLEKYFNLVESKELPDCYIVLTSRHEAGRRIRPYCDTPWEIVGFTRKDARRYIKKYFKGKEHLAEKLIETLWPDGSSSSNWSGNSDSGSSDGSGFSNNDSSEWSESLSDLRELTSNPLNTALLCVLFEDFEGVFPANRTELYIEIVLCVLRRYEKKNGISSKSKDLISVYKQELVQLGSMALQSLREGELYFEKHEFSNALSKFGFLSIQAGGSKRYPCLRFGFLHKSFQEFFSGFYLAFQIIDGEIDCDSVVTDERYRNELKQVFLFMSGLLALHSEETAVSLVNSIVAHMHLCGLSNADISKELLEFALDCILACKINKGDLRSQLIRTLGKRLQLKTVKSRFNIPKHFKLFSEVLKVDTCLTNLGLFGNWIGDSGAASLSEVLKVNTCLTNLDLRMNEIGDSGAASLSEALKVNTCLTSLDLIDNGIGDSGAASLSEALKVNTCLTNLDLGENEIGASGAASFSEALKVNTFLTSLDLSVSEIGDSGAASLSEALTVNTCLTSLYLIMSEIGDSGAASLSEALTVNTCLTSLDLSFNEIGVSGAASLSEALTVNTCLTSLDLSFNEIRGDFIAASLSEALKVNTCLTNLNLGNDKIGASGAASLSEALTVNTCLTNLDLSRNSIGDSGAALLSEVLKVNTCLTNLNLSDNWIGASGAASLSEALKVNTNLTCKY